VFPKLIEIANKKQGAELSLHQELFLLLKSIDPTRQDLESWRFSNNLLSSLKNSFKIISSIRQFAIDKLPEVSPEEQNYSLGVSFLRHSRFKMNQDNDVSNKSNIICFLAAAYYLSKMPKCASN
jgi:hypothetical protein